MRSDRDKTADPNRDIDDFLSKFEDDISEESEVFEDYLDDNSSKSSKQNFQWKEVASVKSVGKVKSAAGAERTVVKDPAPSSIKVQRINNSDDIKPVYPFNERKIETEKPSRPEAVEPQKAVDNDKLLDELFADVNENDTSADYAEEASPVGNASDIVSDTSDKAERKPLFKGLISFLGIGRDKPELIDKEESVSDSKSSVTPDELDEMFGIDKAETEELKSDNETESIDQSIESVDSAESPAMLEESSIVNVDNVDGADETDVTDEADVVEDGVDIEDVVYSFDLSNKSKIDITEPSSGYFKEDPDGEYIKVDPGKRKRIEFKETAASSRKSGISALFSGSKSRKTKKVKAPKEKKTIRQRLFLKKNPQYNPDESATYVLDGKTIKNKPFKFSFLKLIRDFVVVGIIMALIGAGVGAYVIYHAPVYNYNDIYATVATSSIVYNDEGKQFDSIYYTENRRLVSYEDLPDNLVNAFVAIEDKTFWKHHGFNWVRMVGAVISSITGHGQISGTSTITQQLSRNVYLPEEKSDRNLKRKFLEMYYAARLEYALSKEQIMEAYLNTIYLGHGCYGVNAAARTYFSKSVKDLDLIECAALAALPQAPHNYSLLKYADDGGDISEDSKVIQKSPDKVVTNDISKSRRQLTLDLMLEQEMITQKEHDECYDEVLNDFINPNLKSGSGNYTYFHEYLVDTIIADLMEQKSLSFEDAERMVYTGGLQIYSTLDSKAQNVIAKEFRDGSNFPDVSAIWRQDADGNILNNDGKIALYDYDDYFDSKDNFTLRADDKDIKFRDDGSAVIYAGRNLNIYETEVDGATDYSIEFKNYYTYQDGVVYSIQGGYVNIPSTYKSGDGKGNVIVSADFFNDDNYKNIFKKDGNNLIIKEAGYSLGRKIRQPQGAMVIVQVGTGEVKAMVGGRQFNGQRLLNRATNPRQPGSSIKPLAVYGAALQKSYELEKKGKKWTYTDYRIDRQGTKGWGDYVTVHSSIEDERTYINGKAWPLNASRTYTGKNNFRTAIQQSINTCAVKLVYQLTPEYAMKQVKKFGITTLVDVDDNKRVNDVNPAAMALGAMTEGVTPLDMALAYAAFPAGGKVNTPICYTKVLDRNGELLLEGKSEQTRAMNAGVAWIMTDVLQGVVTRGIATAANISDVQSAGKTGTTNDNYDIWFDGFTPSYAAALWIGTDNNIEMSGTSYTAAALWSKIMDQIPKAKKGKYKKQPSNVIEKWGDYYTEGTETGLSSWSYAEMKKQARDAAYKKWQKQRQSHRKWIDTTYKTIVKGYEKMPDPKDPSRLVDDPSKPIKKKVVDVEGHWEYEKGWRDGDFSYKFDGNTYSD